MTHGIDLKVPVLKLVTEIFTLVAENDILYECYESVTLGTERGTKITTNL